MTRSYLDGGYSGRMSGWKGPIVDFDTWHHLWLLRPLFAFVLACPLLIAAVFAGRSRHRRDAKPKQAAEKEPSAPDSKHSLSRGYEVARSARLAANEWEMRRLTELEPHQKRCSDGGFGQGRFFT